MSMAYCKECIHQPVCDVWGGTFKRNDVEHICGHYMGKEKVMGFDEFWKKWIGCRKGETCPQCPRKV